MKRALTQTCVAGKRINKIDTLLFTQPFHISQTFRNIKPGNGSGFEKTWSSKV